MCDICKKNELGAYYIILNHRKRYYLFLTYMPITKSSLYKYKLSDKQAIIYSIKYDKPIFTMKDIKNVGSIRYMHFKFKNCELSLSSVAISICPNCIK